MYSFRTLFSQLRDIDHVKMISCLKSSQKKLSFLFSFIICFYFFSLPTWAFVPDDDISPIPNHHNVWIKQVFVPDDAGVMNTWRETYENWVRLEEYVDFWSLRSTNMYRLPTMDEKRDYTLRTLLRYVDKRLSGEIRRSKEGSTLYAVGQAQKALKPQSEVKVSPFLKLKFKLRVIQQRGFMLVKNPWMDYQLSIKFNGETQMTLTKDIRIIGVYASVNYEMWQNRWVMAFDKKINSTLSSRLSSTQDDSTLAFTRKADTRLEFFYNHRF